MEHLKDVSIVILVRNTLGLLQDNLPTLRETFRDTELIVVDGNSTDGSREFAEKYADKVVGDEGKGLAYARQLGANTATRPYILFAGGDNRIPAATVEAMARALARDPKLAGVGVQTTVIDAHNYWEKVSKHIFHHMINRVGRVEVVGTPSMYRRDALRQVNFNEAIRACDDTDLGYRLVKAGYHLEIIDAYAEEKNAIDFAEFYDRWFGYGRSDAEFYAAHSSGWGLKRKMQSFTHPLRKYGFKGTWRFLIGGDILFIPGLWIALVVRYWGWIRAARRGYFGRFTHAFSAKSKIG